MGERVRVVRQAAGLRQQDLSDAAKWLGLRSWSPTRIAGIERGAKAISAEDLLRLVAVLSRATGRDVDVAELFDSADYIKVTDAASIEARQVVELLRGRAVTWHLSPTSVDLGEQAAAAARSSAILRAAGRNRLPIVGETRRVAQGMREADERAARALGLAAYPFETLCVVLWGRSLSDERDARLAARGMDGDAAETVRARRGRITRELLAEARTLIDRADETGA